MRLHDPQEKRRYISPSPEILPVETAIIDVIVHRHLKSYQSKLPYYTFQNHAQNATLKSSDDSD